MAINPDMFEELRRVIVLLQDYPTAGNCGAGSR